MAVSGHRPLRGAIDLYSRRIVGWAASNRMKKDLALKALRRAIALRNPPAGLIHHSYEGRYIDPVSGATVERSGP